MSKITINEGGETRPMTKDDLPKLYAVLGIPPKPDGFFKNAALLRFFPFVVIGYIAHLICHTVLTGLAIGWTASRDEQ